MSQLDLHAHVMAVLSGLEDLSLVSLRALREALESRVGISLRDQTREIRHHAESAIAELSDRACFARESAQRAAEDCVLKTIHVLPFGSLFLMLIVEGACSRGPSGMTT